ncbi:succinate dehydrogenase, cytochrome b556 subunit [Methylobacterium sp. P31]
MATDYDRRRPTRARPSLTAQELKGTTDSGRTADKVDFADPAAAPLGIDDEAAGTPDTPRRVAAAMRQELEGGSGEKGRGGRSPAVAARPRPVSPNIQIYRPQLTSVLSIANRITGVFLALGALGLVAWLAAGASGPHAYANVHAAFTSLGGQLILFGFTFVFFLHFCGGIRHLVWDTVRGFEAPLDLSGRLDRGRR